MFVAVLPVTEPMMGPSTCTTGRRTSGLSKYVDITSVTLHDSGLIVWKDEGI